MRNTIGQRFQIWIHAPERSLGELNTEAELVLQTQGRYCEVEQSNPKCGRLSHGPFPSSHRLSLGIM